MLARSLDYERTLAEVAQLAVPEFADWCAADIVQPDGSLRQITSGHPDPRMDDLYESVNQLVREADANQEDPRLTFYRIKGLALAAANGRGVPVGAVAALPERPATPRLSEPWFC